MSPLTRKLLMMNTTNLSSRKKRKTRRPTEDKHHDDSSRKTRGMQLVRCSFTPHDQPKKHLVITYTFYSRKFVIIPVHTLFPPTTKPPITFRLDLKEDQHDVHLDSLMSCMYTNLTGKEKIYLFGGLTPRKPVKKVYCFDLTTFKKTGKLTQCKSMIHRTYLPLVFKVGDGRIFVFGRKTAYEPRKTGGDYFTLQEYNIEKDTWSLIEEKNNLCVDMHRLDRTLTKPNLLPHVVIGHKLHISFGGSSFSFDTVKHVWEDCNLFETFWSNSGFTPLNFYGGMAYAGAADKKPDHGEKKGGPPFGFYGRGILWGKNILLGVHYTERRISLVAFLLDDNGTSVVKSQPLDLTSPDRVSKPHSGRLVDLGRDGYFGYTHFYHNDKISSWIDDGHFFIIELVVFKLLRRQQGLASDDHFLECQVISREVLEEKATRSEWEDSDAF